MNNAARLKCAREALNAAQELDGPNALFFLRSARQAITQLQGFVPCRVISELVVQSESVAERIGVE